MLSQVARLRDAKDSAKDSIREMGSVRAAHLRSAYHSLRQRSLQAVGSRTDLPEADVLGHDGLLRVRSATCCRHWVVLTKSVGFFTLAGLDALMVLSCGCRR